MLVIQNMRRAVTASDVYAMIMDHLDGIYDEVTDVDLDIQWSPEGYYVLALEPGDQAAYVPDPVGSGQFKITIEQIG